MANLTDIQIDALKELGNIGAGHAATALSQLISEVIDISIPSVKVVPLSDVSYALGGPERIVYVVYLEVTRNINGTMITIFSPETSLFLAKRLLKEENASLESEIASSALKEAGSILCGSYLSAMCQIVGTTAVASVPTMACDMLGAMLDYILVEIGKIADEVFLIEVDLYVAGRQLECSQLFLPKPATLDFVLSSIGM